MVEQQMFQEKSSILKLKSLEMDNLFKKLNPEKKESPLQESSEQTDKELDLSPLDAMIKQKLSSNASIKRLNELYIKNKQKSEPASKRISKQPSLNEHEVLKDLRNNTMIDQIRLLGNSEFKKETFLSNIESVENNAINNDQSVTAIKLSSSQKGGSVLKNMLINPKMGISKDSINNKSSSEMVSYDGHKRSRLETINHKSSKESINTMGKFLKGIADNILHQDLTTEKKKKEDSEEKDELNESKNTVTEQDEEEVSQHEEDDYNASSNLISKPKLEISNSVNLLTNMKQGDKNGVEIFWTRNELLEIQSKFRLAGSKLREKQKQDFDLLFTHIYKRDKEQVYRILKNRDFVDFYKLELKKPYVLENIFLNDMPDVVGEMIDFDEMFSFSTSFIFTYIERVFKRQEIYIEEDEIQRNFFNLIKWEFYNKEQAWLIFWFLCHFTYLKEAQLLFTECLVIKSDQDICNIDFEDVSKLTQFAEASKNCSKAIKCCLEYGYENLAFSLTILYNMMSDTDIVQTAIENCKLKFLRVIWERHNIGVVKNLLDIENSVSEEDIQYETMKKKYTSHSSIDYNGSDRKSSRSQIEKMKSEEARSSGDREGGMNSLNISNIKSKNAKTNVDKGNSFTSGNSKRKTIMQNIAQLSKSFKGDPPFTISYLLNELNDNGKFSQINEIVTTWKYIDNDKDLIETLFKRDNFDEIGYLIWKKRAGKWRLNENHFDIVIKADQLELIPFFLGLPECRTLLHSKDTQKYIVENYFKFGNKIYYAAIMLGFIDIGNWDTTLTKEMCRLIFILMKNRDIMNCHSPIITSVLLCEFMKKMGEVSVEHHSRCNKVIESLFKFVNNIQEANPNEVYIKFLMQQKDIKGRNSFEIASDNDFFNVLESPELGTIVKKMWNGKLSAHPLTMSSSINRFLYQDVSTSTLYSSLDSFEEGKYYTYHMSVWFDSCSLRFMPEAITTISLILIYNLFIYFLVSEKLLLEPFSDYDDICRLLYYLYLFLVISINFSNLNYIIYCYLTQKKVKKTVLVYFELLLLLLSFSMMVDSSIFGYDKNNMDLIKKFNGIAYYETDYGSLLRISIFSICDLIVWMKITVIMLTWRDIGPLIHIIYLMIKIMLYYIFVLSLYLTCFAGIFTIVFYKHSEQFAYFTATVTTLFSGFINNFDCTNFNQGDIYYEKYKVYGGFCIMIYVTLSGMLIINLLIAFLSNFYRLISKVVDSTHRAVLISYHKKYKWNHQYGWIIFLVPPFNLINIFFLGFTFFLNTDKSIQTFNKYVCRIYHSMFIMPVMLIGFILYSILNSILAYIKGTVLFLVNGDSRYNYNVCIALALTFKWIVIGYPYLLYIIYKDCIHIMKTCFDIYPTKISEINRIKKFIKDENVLLFLRFIHGRQKTDSNDLHSIFIDYLNYETQQMTENNAKLKERSNYLTKLQTAGSQNVNRKTKMKNPTIFMSKHTAKAEDESGSMMINSITKKNLIIIEILENFLIDDSSDNHVVDIEKLKMLLPKTTKIDNDYLKRLVFTDINSVNKAINKLKSKKNVFLQNSLLKKIVASAIRVDAEMDEKIGYTKGNKEDENEKIQKKQSLKKYIEGKKTDDVSEYEFYSEMYTITKRIKDDIEEILRIRKTNNSNIRFDSKNKVTMVHQE